MLSLLFFYDLFLANDVSKNAESVVIIMEFCSPVLPVVVPPIVLDFMKETISPSFDVFFNLMVKSCKIKMAVRGARNPKKCWKKIR